MIEVWSAWCCSVMLCQFPWHLASDECVFETKDWELQIRAWLSLIPSLIPSCRECALRHWSYTISSTSYRWLGLCLTIECWMLSRMMWCSKLIRINKKNNIEWKKKEVLFTVFSPHPVRLEGRCPLKKWKKLIVLYHCVLYSSCPNTKMWHPTFVGERQ